ncbi:hypothetical protein KOR42_54600 [Thalassoglobus neptunius]|uniref:Uncharacterized protein n=1 Tax=Thalassoglobus neptunius TaxID=1938619 RepID=A0A5C5UVZ4_9PLAN|nr:hypothetical protein [Thalassoglobus neptunius]TWT30521.1 hypothetical protein KOR42_54600 [Thalassoglobus neptunius]
MRTRNISLLGLLAIVTCFAIGISHVITSIRLARANAELTSLRQRLELIDVDDTDQIAARRLPTSEQFLNRWVVRLPDPKEKRLYANWGTAPLTELCNLNAAGLRTFGLAPNPDTHETFVQMRFVLNPNDPNWGSVVIEIDGKISHITVNPEIVSLLMGETPAKTISVSDSPTIRSSTSPLTLYSVESTSGDGAALCLWIDGVEPQDGG